MGSFPGSNWISADYVDASYITSHLGLLWDCVAANLVFKMFPQEANLIDKSQLQTIICHWFWNLLFRHHVLHFLASYGSNLAHIPISWSHLGSSGISKRPFGALRACLGGPLDALGTLIGRFKIPLDSLEPVLGVSWDHLELSGVPKRPLWSSPGVFWQPLRCSWSSHGPI